MKKNASAASCKMGYRLYYAAKSKSLSFDRDLLNVTLVKGGYDAISERTWGNYEKQYEAGIPPKSYYSINQWDYFHAGVPGQFIDSTEPGERAA